jgi:hypothetical protein
LYGLHHCLDCIAAVFECLLFSNFSSPKHYVKINFLTCIVYLSSASEMRGPCSTHGRDEKHTFGEKAFKEDLVIDGLIILKYILEK